MSKTKQNRYKRKFMVPSETPRTRYIYDNYCSKDCVQAKMPYPNKCHGIGSYFARERCVHKDKLYANYIVSETLDGEWQCSCPHWKFRRQECSHIRKAQSDPKKYEIDVNFTGKLTDVFTKVFES